MARIMSLLSLGSLLFSCVESSDQKEEHHSVSNVVELALVNKKIDSFAVEKHDVATTLLINRLTGVCTFYNHKLKELGAFQSHLK